LAAIADLLLLTLSIPELLCSMMGE